MNEKLEELYKAARRKQEIIINKAPEEEFYKTEEFYKMLVEDLLENLLISAYYQQKYKGSLRNRTKQNIEV